MNLLHVILIAVLIVAAISIVQNSNSTYVSTFKVKVLNFLTIEFNKKEKRSDKTHHSNPNTPKS